MGKDKRHPVVCSVSKWTRFTQAEEWQSCIRHRGSQEAERPTWEPDQGLERNKLSLDNLIFKGLEKSKSSGSHYMPASASRHSSATAKEDEELEDEDLTDDTAGSYAEESSLHQNESEPER